MNEYKSTLDSQTQILTMDGISGKTIHFIKICSMKDDKYLEIET